MTTIPGLEHGSASWVAVSRATGRAVMETFCRRTAEAINQDRYEVLTVGQWLARFNAAARAA